VLNQPSTRAFQFPTEKHARLHRAPLSMEWKAAVEQIILALGVASFSLFLLG
jgi:hypothetical protein